MGDSQIRVGPSRNVANNRASLESELLARVEVGNHDGRLELRDTRDGHGRLLLGVVVILVGLVVNLGEKLGGDTRAALQRSELGMIDRNLEGIFSAKRRGGRRGGRWGGFSAAAAGEGLPLVSPAVPMRTARNKRSIAPGNKEGFAPAG